MITLKQAVEVLDAQVASGENLLNREVKMACGSDMMSDVLAYAKNKAVLLTGLLNIQVVRTADVRDKHPESDVLMAAKRKDIPVLYTKCTMFEACGRLYSLGLRGCTAKDAESR